MNESIEISTNQMCKIIMMIILKVSMDHLWFEYASTKQTKIEKKNFYFNNEEKNKRFFFITCKKSLNRRLNLFTYKFFKRYKITTKLTKKTFIESHDPMSKNNIHENIIFLLFS